MTDDLMKQYPKFGDQQHAGVGKQSLQLDMHEIMNKGQLGITSSFFDWPDCYTLSAACIDSV